MVSFSDVCSLLHDAGVRSSCNSVVTHLEMPRAAAEPLALLFAPVDDATHES